MVGWLIGVVCGESREGRERVRGGRERRESWLSMENNDRTTRIPDWKRTVGGRGREVN